MASHMICVRISPLAPTSAPAMMSSGLSSTKPAATAASPESELSSAITTGISAPPIGVTAKNPSSAATASSSQSHRPPARSATMSSPNTAQVAVRQMLTTRMPGNPLVRSIPCSLANATRLPVKVTAPMNAAIAAAELVRTVASARSMRSV